MKIDMATASDDEVIAKQKALPKCSRLRLLRCKSGSSVSMMTVRKERWIPDSRYRTSGRSVLLSAASIVLGDPVALQAIIVSADLLLGVNVQSALWYWRSDMVDYTGTFVLGGLMRFNLWSPSTGRSSRDVQSSSSWVRCLRAGYERLSYPLATLQESVASLILTTWWTGSPLQFWKELRERLVVNLTHQTRSRSRSTFCQANSKCFVKSVT